MNRDNDEINEIFEQILNTVSAYFQVPVEHILQHDRRKYVVLARMVVFYIAKEKFGMTYPTIGKQLNGRDHTTVMHGYTKINDKIKNDKKFSDQISRLMNTFNDSRSNLDIVHIEYEDDPNQISEQSHIIEDTLPKIYTPEEKIVAITSLSKERQARSDYIIKLWDSGWTLDGIAKRMGLSRERVRQIIEVGLIHEMKILLLAGKKIDINTYIGTRKSEHEKIIKQIQELERNEREKIKENERIKLEKLRKIRAKQWSMHYTKCGICGTTKKPHRTNGYCIDCYSKSPEHRASCKRSANKRKEKTKEYLKEYYKRPDVIKRRKQICNETKYGGNREKALIRDEYKCTICDISQKDAISSYGRDLYVYHINNIEDHALNNLKSVCKKCYENAINKRLKKYKL